MCWFDITINVCVALGGLGTVGTLIYMILSSKNQAKQVKEVQEIQSIQLDALYKPDIRIIAWTESLINEKSHPYIRIANNGENLIINDIKELSESVLNKEGIRGWFPLNFDKSIELSIPLNDVVLNIRPGDLFYMIVTNKLNQQYSVAISKSDNIIKITKIVKI